MADVPGSQGSKLSALGAAPALLALYFRVSWVLINARRGRGNCTHALATSRA